MEIASFDEMWRQVSDSAATASVPPQVPLNTTRRSLFYLLGQADIVELTGSVEDFGGAEQVRDAVLAGIRGLMEVAQSFNVQLLPAGNALASALPAEPVEARGEQSSDPPPAAMPEIPADYDPFALESPPPPAETAVPLASPEKVANDGSDGKKPEQSEKLTPPASKEGMTAEDFYAQTLQNCRSEAERAKVWKEIMGNAALDGPAKGRLSSLNLQTRRRLATAA